MSAPDGGMSSLWRDIATAPKDGSRVLLFRNGHIVCGRWDNDRFSTKPRPYWLHDNIRIFGKQDARDCPPSRWMPLDAPITEPTP